MIWERKDVSVVQANPQPSHTGPVRRTRASVEKKERRKKMMLHSEKQVLLFPKEDKHTLCVSKCVGLLHNLHVCSLYLISFRETRYVVNI